MMVSKNWHQIILVAACLLLTACATNPVSKNGEFVLLSETQELKLGQQAAAEVAKSYVLLPKSDPLVQYIDKVGQRVAKTSDRPELFYRFHVVDDKTINAFALPGGYIYLHRGLITHMNSEAELAAVLGHEIGHVTARHSVQQYTKAQAYQLGMTITSIFLPIPHAIGQLSSLVATAVISGYGREAEFQSDQLSLKYLAASGYDPRATGNILQTLQRLDALDIKEKKDAGEKAERYHGAFSTHPETKKRIERAINTASQANPQARDINRDAMIKIVDGYPYADNSKDGAVIGNRFIHPELNIQFKFPDKDINTKTGWMISNKPNAVEARVRKQPVYFQLMTKQLQKRQSAGDILRAGFPKRHLGKVTEDTLNGMPHAHAFVTMSAPHVSEARISAHIFLRHDQAFIITMWTKRADFAKYIKQFAGIAYSFRDYNKQRDGDVPRIMLYQWRNNDSWLSLARKFGKTKEGGNILGKFTSEKLAALNGMNSNQKPAVGTIIKLVH
ncbi:MAG: M48 family metalloprotease [Mariprofundales bacterium]